MTLQGRHTCHELADVFLHSLRLPDTWGAAGASAPCCSQACRIVRVGYSIPYHIIVPAAAGRAAGVGQGHPMPYPVPGPAAAGRAAAQEDLMLVNENTRRNLEQEVAGFRAHAAAGERAMQARPLFRPDSRSAAHAAQQPRPSRRAAWLADRRPLYRPRAEQRMCGFAVHRVSTLLRTAAQTLVRYREI